MNIEQKTTDLSVTVESASFLSERDKSNQHFIPLGVLNNFYFFYSKRLKTVVKIRVNQFKPENLIQLAPLSWWKIAFPSCDARFKHSVKWSEIAEFLIEKSIEFGQWQGVVSAISIHAKLKNNEDCK